MDVEIHVDSGSFWSIRAIGPEDAPALARLHGELFPTGWNSATFAAFCGEAGIAALAAVAKNEIVGFAVCRVAADEAEILTLGVAPHWRRRGAGRALLCAALESAQMLGAKAVFLEVAQGNAPALALYQRTGFFCIGRREGYYQIKAEGEVELEAALVFRRNLSQIE